MRTITGVVLIVTGDLVSGACVPDARLITNVTAPIASSASDGQTVYERRHEETEARAT